MYSVDVVIPVYKPAQSFRSTLEALARQKISPEVICSIIIVDDGSHDDHLGQLVNEFEGMHLLTLARNRGRAQARNAGAYNGTAEFILFIDADCQVSGSDLINRHCNILTSGIDVSFGNTKPQLHNDGFWTGYFSAIEARRNKAAINGDFLALTSSHFAIRRTVFTKAGGFDSNYRQYGFEDRDLIATLIHNKAKMHYDPDLTVLHNVDFSLSEICRKMTEAGQHTAGLFADKHPDVYSRMAFSYFDVGKHPIALKIPFLLSIPIVSVLPQLFDKLLSKSLLPMPFAHLMVKSLSALAFLQGTARRTQEYS